MARYDFETQCHVFTANLKARTMIRFPQNTTKSCKSN